VKRRRFLILGAGPSGLSFAHRLKAAGEESFTIIEKESEVGGLCRSVTVEGAPVDIGGGHFLDPKHPPVLDMVFAYMPRREWREFSRVSKIRLKAGLVDYPLESNLWQLPLNTRLDVLQSVAEAGCVQGTPPPAVFPEWVRWRLGTWIADNYLLPYNRKLWSVDLKTLGTHWLEKLPAVSFREILESVLTKRPCGTMPAHRRFLYPQAHGYGEIWRRMGEAMSSHIEADCPVASIDPADRTVNGRFRADTIVTTIPWPLWTSFAPLPKAIAEAVSSLKAASVDVVYRTETPDTDAHWIYEPGEADMHHRLLCRANFFPGSRGHWEECNARRRRENGGLRFENPFSYPVPTAETPRQMQIVEDWARKSGILPLGRWGGWRHLNSDAAAMEAMTAAEEMLRT
jgi:protoporphyrinogen oxidase